MMESSFAASIKLVCQTLNQCKVDYLLVGGAAVALHGYFRYSTTASGEIAEKIDLDIWYNPSYTNYFNLLGALEELGKDVAKYRNEQAPNPKTSFFRYDFEQFTLDILPEINSGLDFMTAFKSREIKEIEGIEFPFLSFDSLIKDKKHSGRPKDLEDIEQLKRLRNDSID